MPSLMIQGTSSGAGKTVLVAALCRIFSNKGFSVAPFKSQNMSSFSYSGANFEISRAQAIQAVAARCKITADLNPILLKPLGNYYSMVFLQGKKWQKIHASQYYKEFALTRGIDTILDSLRRLEKQYNLIIVEGAGSPAEINLERYDIANMRIAKAAESSVLLVSDIDRGGSFASIVGTISLLKKQYQEMIKGIIINKFRGDPAILEPGLRRVTKITKKPVLGTIPMMQFKLPEEDSQGGKAEPFKWDKVGLELVDKEITKIARLVEKNLDIAKIARLVKC